MLWKRCQSKQHAKGRKSVLKVIILTDRKQYTFLVFNPTAPITQQCELAKRLFGEC